MTRGVSASWSVAPIDFARIGDFGPDHLLSRWAHHRLPASAPLLKLDQPSSSQSAFCDRDALADLLNSINGRFRRPLSDSTLAAIRGGALFVIAGQQPGLALGPVYTLLKAIGAITLARRLSQQWGGTVLPAFWIAGEDHDIQEVNRCAIGGRKHVIDHAETGRSGPRPPVGCVSLAAHRQSTLDFLRQSLADTPHGAWAVELAESCDWSDYATHFGQMLAKLLGPRGLILIDPMRMRPLSGPVLAAMAERWPQMNAAFDAGSAALKAAGLPAPLDRLNLFHIGPEGRVSIQVSDSTAAAIRADPRSYSPGAALRPIVQDAILPTAATLGGPSELAYLWQIDAMYGVMNIHRSPIQPRPSATFIDATTARRAARFNLGGERLFAAADPAPADAPPDAEVEELETLGAALSERIARMPESYGDKSIAKARESIRYQLAKIARRVRQLRLEAAGIGRKQRQRIDEVIRPGGKLQERGWASLELLGRFGPSWIDAALERLDPLMAAHQLIQTGDGFQEGALA